MAQRYYSSTAGDMALTVGVDSASTTINVNTVQGLPVTTPFTLVVDVDQEAEEIVTVTSVAGTALTVVRGEDGTAAQSHTTGAAVRHMVTARDLREPQQHMVATIAHGATSPLVGRDDTVTLTNKTISGADNSISDVPTASIVGLDAAIAGKADVDHTHTTAQVTGLDTALADKAASSHTHTTAQVTGLDTALADKAPTSHTHDDRYYTEAESDSRYHPASTAFIRRLGSADLYLRWDGNNTIVGGYGSEYELAPLNATVGKASAWGGDVNAVRYSAGPTSGAYSRNAGTNRFAAYMDDGLEWGRNVSSRRYKDAIEPATVDVNAVLALEPVTYHRKTDAPDVRDLGLIAEDCVDIPFLVAYDVERDEDGQPVPGAEQRPEAVRYESVLPVLLLAVVKEQAAQIAALTERVAHLEG